MGDCCSEGDSHNYGPFLVMDYITAPNILRVPKWDPNFGNYPFIVITHTSSLTNQALFCVFTTHAPALISLKETNQTVTRHGRY